MNNKVVSVLCVSLFFTNTLFAEVHQNQELTVYQVMQKVLDRYPSLKISSLAVEQAGQQRQQVESQLGWILNGSGGMTHDLTALGTPSDRLDVTGSIGRKLSSGASVSLDGGYRYEDSSLSFSPVLPNPAHTTRLDLNYRLPFLQGDGNPLYQEGITSSETGYRIAKANLSLTRLQLAEKVKDLFYASALTEARLENTKQSVQRTHQLEKAIDKDVKLGLLEKKDQLQVRAQLDSVLAELSTIQIQKQQQQSSLNRLMLEDWNKSTTPVLINAPNIKKYSVSTLIKQTEAYHPSLKIVREKLTLAESQINSAYDSKKDSLDLVLSVGSRTSDGESTTGTVSEQDWAGSVKVEYKHLFDNKGVSAKYTQALIEKNIAQQNIHTLKDDIRYGVSGMLAEIKAAQIAVTTAERQLYSESLKLKDAEQRFRSGRTNTTQLIQFHNEFSFAALSLQNKKIDLNNRIIALQIYSGGFWSHFSSNNAEPEYAVPKDTAVQNNAPQNFAPGNTALGVSK